VGLTARQYDVRFVDGGEQRLRKVHTGWCTVSNKVFYKEHQELGEGAYKIVDGSMILLKLKPQENKRILLLSLQNQK